MQVRRVLRTGAAVALGTVLALTGLPAPAGAIATSAAHPYSDPIWFPLHVPVTVGCIGTHARNNGPIAGPNPCAADHAGYFAINLDIPSTAPDQHPAVYAAGAGTVIEAHVASSRCVPAGGSTSGGSEVVVEHGGGIVSIYQHLNSVAVRVGSRVTPRTALGTAGWSGARCASGATPGTAYLDFQIHRNGGGYLTATAMTITTLRGCSGRSVAVWPRDLPATVYSRPGGAAMPVPRPATWLAVPYLARIATPAGWDCLPATVPATPSRPGLTRASRATTTAALSWPAAAGATGYEAQLQIWRPSTHQWDAPCSPYLTRGCTVGYYALSGAAHSWVLRGLAAGRIYRIRLSAHDAAGWSVPSAWHSLIPLPSAPAYRRLLGYAHSVVLSWTVPALHGTALAGYQVAISRRTATGWTAWAFTTTNRATSHTWTGTRPGTQYRVTVRARTTTGYDGPWMSVHYRTTLHH